MDDFVTEDRRIEAVKELIESIQNNKNKYDIYKDILIIDIQAKRAIYKKHINNIASNTKTNANSFYIHSTTEQKRVTPYPT